MPKKFSDLPPKMQRLLTVYPMRNRVNWVNKNDVVTLVYPKDFSRFETWMHKRIGGPDLIKRPLDEVGSKIWLMCDGKHTLKEICTDLDEQYHEEIEPVLDRVWKFLEILLSSNLIRLSPKRVYPNKLRVTKKKIERKKSSKIKQ